MSLPSPPSGGPFRSQIGPFNDARSAASTSSSTGSSKSQQPLAHVQDLQDRALEGLDKNQTITTLLTQAENSLRQACTLVEYRKPDLAYGEYVRCYEIVVNIIYQNPGFPTFKSARGPSYSRYNYLIKRITEREAQFQSIKEIIENDNKRNNTQPRLPPVLMSGHRLAQIRNGDLSSSPHLSDPVDSRYSSGQNGVHASSSTSLQHPQLGQPPVNGMADESQRKKAELLNERFARLRQAQGNYPPSISSVTSPVTSPTLGSAPQDQWSSSAINGARPIGPRPMTGGLQIGPNDLTLDTEVTHTMPQPPTPIYTPARNMQITGDLQLPRSSARSMVGTGGRTNSIASSIGAITSPRTDDGFQTSPRPSMNGNGGRGRSGSVYLPKETRIGAEKLYDYLKMHSVLLIDCRSRQEFDDGHIFAQSIICVEPSLLKRDQSAEELQERLILSPEQEQDLFTARDQFDLVVYYDDSTLSDSFLRNPRTDADVILRCLHDTLLEFNGDKPLQRPPILLMGGLRAWTELVGNQALKTSNTATLVRTTRPIRRVPAPDVNQRLQNQMRRRRDYNPLEPEEEDKWRELARKESVVVDPRSDLLEEESAVNDNSLLETIDEFNRRFPDAASIGQPIIEEYSPPSRPIIPPKIPEYPATSSHSRSTLPTIPKRPAPAAPRVSYSGVNERSVSSPKSAELPAYVPLHLQPSNLRLPRTGLVNFGVTCYMNATIQAMSATLPLSAFFLDDRYKSLVQRENWKGSKGVLPDLFANLVRSIWKGDVEAIRPSTLRQFCARLNREWGIDRQQDAKEFFDFIVDCLHEDLNKHWSKTPLRALTEEQEMKREKMPKMIVCKTEWDRYTHREQSYITSLFAGQHASRLRCTICSFTSTTYEAFYSISVEIPRTGKSTIQDCLESYCQEEMLSGDEVWKCPRCKKQREATKQITITRAPQYLVVHFKRFSASKNESAKKVRTPINFPLVDLDLEPYMLPAPSAVERDAILRANPEFRDLRPDSATSPPYMYDAYAVMRHIGTTMGSGHYTCLARDKTRGCWRQFNDTTITDFDPERLAEREKLTNEQAYIVFYERKGVSGR